MLHFLPPYHLRRLRREILTAIHLEVDGAEQSVSLQGPWQGGSVLKEMKVRKEWKARCGTCRPEVAGWDLVSKSSCQHPEVPRQQVSCTKTTWRKVAEGSGLG